MRSLNRSLIVASIAVLVSGCFATAQGVTSAANDPSKPTLQFAQRFENNVMGIAKAIPADKYNFAPSSDIFKAGSPAKFDTVRTVAQQLTHSADMCFRFYEPYIGKPDTDIDLKNLDKITSKDEVLKVLQVAFDYQNKAIATLTAENAFAPKGPRNMTLMAAILLVIADDEDHYGQLVVYGRMNGIIPPATEQQQHLAPPVVPQK
jgi:hypothetical protein